MFNGFSRGTPLQVAPENGSCFCPSSRPRLLSPESISRPPWRRYPRDTAIYGWEQGRKYNAAMTADERAQLVEDIKRSSRIRNAIAERAERDPKFDIAAAWQELDELDADINRRVIAARLAPDNI